MSGIDQQVLLSLRAELDELRRQRDRAVADLGDCQERCGALKEQLSLNMAEQRNIGAIVVENIFQAIRDEREACAKVAETISGGWVTDPTRAEIVKKCIATLIRARSKE